MDNTSVPHQDQNSIKRNNSDRIILLISLISSIICIIIAFNFYFINKQLNEKIIGIEENIFSINAKQIDNDRKISLKITNEEMYAKRISRLE